MTAQDRTILTHELTCARLRDMVLSGQLQPGQPVTIQGLVSDLDAGMTPVREAIRRLIAEGALTLQGNRRVLVPHLTPALPDQIAFARCLCAAGHQAAPGGTCGPPAERRDHRPAGVAGQGRGPGDPRRGIPVSVMADHGVGTQIIVHVLDRTLFQSPICTFSVSVTAQKDAIREPETILAEQRCNVIQNFQSGFIHKDCGSVCHRAIAFEISVLLNVNIHGTRGRIWSSSAANFTRFLHEHGLTVSNAIPLLFAMTDFPHVLQDWRISKGPEIGPAHSSRYTIVLAYA
ncbi:MAG: GntR family transcriptional regulator [Rhodobacter sp.]|nr:GntR family transcriptional regulator [Rhodobacter sp.]